MSNKIILKKSSVGAKIPVTGDLEYGELAVNYADGKLYFKNSGNAIQSFDSSSYTKVTSNTTALAGKKYLADTSGGTFTITLPASPAIGDSVTIADGASFLTTPLTVARNSSTIADTADNLSLNIEGVSVTLVYDGSTWEVYTQVGANGGDQSGLVTGSSTTTFTNKTISLTSNTITGTTAEFNSALSDGDFATLAGTETLTNKTLTTPTITGATSITYTPGSTTGVALTVTGKDTQGGTGYLDFFKATNTTSGVTNGSKTFRLNNTGGIEIINSAYNANIFTLTNSGNLTVGGTITPSAYTAGQVIKDTMLSNTEVTVVSTTIAATGSNVDFITYDYTPVSSSSYLMVSIHISKYVPAGTVDDSWWSVLKVAGNEIAYGWQKVNDDGNGTSGRSGVLFPLMGRYTNSSTTAKTIAVAARRDTADDSITIDNSATSIWLRITEVAR